MTTEHDLPPLPEAWIKEAMRLADACMSLYSDYRLVVERYGASADTVPAARNAYLFAESELEAHLRTMMEGEPPTIPEGMALVPLEPTEAMKQAGIDVAPSGLLEVRGQLRNRASWSTEECAEVYKAMIQAHQKEEGK